MNVASPLYFRIQQMLRDKIAAGALGAGARIPSESELAAQFATTRSTVRQALAQLTFEGLIVRRAGQGTFVARPRVEGRIAAGRPGAFEEQMEAAGKQISFRVLGFETQAASAEVAATLAIAKGTLVYRLRRLRLVDGEIVGLEDRSMLESIGRSIPASALTTRSAIAMTEAALGTPLGGVTVTVAAEKARVQIARLLGMRVGSPLLTRAHVFFSKDGAPIVTGTSLYRGDKYRFTYEFGRIGR